MALFVSFVLSIVFVFLNCIYVYSSEISLFDESSNNEWISDYTNQEYITVDSGKLMLYKDTFNLYHTFNRTEMWEHIERARFDIATIQDPLIKKELKYTMDSILTEMLQLSVITENATKFTQRYKRNILGTGISWVTGIPDHEDFLNMQFKLNELIDNENLQSSFNKKLDDILKHQDLYKDTFERMNAELRILYLEISNVLLAINLSKNGYIHTSLFNFDEIKSIMKLEKINVDLLDVLNHGKLSVFLYKDVLIFTMKIPIVSNVCVKTYVRALIHNREKLILSEYVANCNGEYIAVENCTNSIFSMICKSNQFNDICTEKLLNHRTNAVCNKEKTTISKNIEILDDGIILVDGFTTINKINYTGIYLILFRNLININDTIYINHKKQFINEGLKHQSLNYKVLEYLEPLQSNLSGPHLKHVSKYEHWIMYTSHFTLGIVVLIIGVVFYIYSKFKQIRNTLKNSDDKNHMNNHENFNVIYSRLNEIETHQKKLFLAPQI